MSKEFPQEFVNRLRTIAPKYSDQILSAFNQPSPGFFRVNHLKSSSREVFVYLEKHNILYQVIDFFPEAFHVTEEYRDKLKKCDLVNEGKVYQQNLSSMLAVKALNPQPHEKILDLCAAPGSKTSQIAALMDNTGELLAVEAVRNRFYKLKSVLALLEVTNTNCLCMDGRRFRVRNELCDRVMVDAPCSSEGRFKMDNPKTFAYWSIRKIKEMVKKQRGLLLNGGRQLKSGGILVYSTCTFSPEENEGVIDWFLRKTQGEFELEDIQLPECTIMHGIGEWGRRMYADQVKQCARIIPEGLAEGFFIAKFRKA